MYVIPLVLLVIFIIWMCDKNRTAEDQADYWRRKATGEAEEDPLEKERQRRYGQTWK